MGLSKNEIKAQIYQFVNSFKKEKKSSSANSLAISSAKAIENENEIENISQDENEIDFIELQKIFNSSCPDLPDIKKISESRKRAVRSRVAEHGLDSLRKVIESVSQSDFLNGLTDRQWKSNFDWIMKPGNYLKIL